MISMIHVYHRRAGDCGAAPGWRGFARHRSKSSQLAEPLQGAAHFGHFQLVAAAELFEPEAFESSAIERGFDEVMRLRRGDWIARTAAQPDRHFQKTSAGVVGLVSFAEAIFVNAAEEESSNAN